MKRSLFDITGQLELCIIGPGVTPGRYVLGATSTTRVDNKSASLSFSLGLFLKKTVDGIVCWRARCCCWPDFCLLLSFSSSYRIDMRIDEEIFRAFKEKQKIRLEQEPNGKKQTGLRVFCLYSVNRVDPSLALRIFPPNRTELRKALKKRDVSAARCFNFPFGSSGKSTGQSSFPIINETLKK